jgi:hypothetical protein
VSVTKSLSYIRKPRGPLQSRTLTLYKPVSVTASLEVFAIPPLLLAREIFSYQFVSSQVGMRTMHTGNADSDPEASAGSWAGFRAWPVQSPGPTVSLSKQRGRSQRSLWPVIYRPPKLQHRPYISPKPPRKVKLTYSRALSSTVKSSISLVRHHVPTNGHVRRR